MARAGALWWSVPRVRCFRSGPTGLPSIRSSSAWLVRMTPTTMQLSRCAHSSAAADTKIRSPAASKPALASCSSELDDKPGEVKSMRTPIALGRKGVGRAILAHIIEVARSRSYERLSLETGSMEAFKPAQRLYESFGFTYCGPFGEYTEDPNSVFMTMRLYAKRRPDPIASTHVRDRRR